VAVFDRTTGIGLDGRLNYKIIANWMIAEHKSQGTMQLLVNRGDVETFWIYRENPPNAHEMTIRLFAALNNTD
jgi:hypothetical protein